MRHEAGDASGDARLKDLTSPVSRPLAFTLRAWPVIAIATIGLSFLTQQGAKLLGIELPDQANITVVKNCLTHAFASAKAFGVAAFLVAQVIVLLPAIEELVFRWGLYKQISRLWAHVSRLASHDLAGEVVRPETGDASGGAPVLRVPSRAVIAVAGLSSALFSAAHYIAQPWPDSAFLALFFFGLAQCWLYFRTQRLWCAMLNHALFNLTNLVLLFVV